MKEFVIKAVVVTYAMSILNLLITWCYEINALAADLWRATLKPEKHSQGVDGTR